MAGHKETPRQKMIGMMYLVLLALLAMNVQREILNSFVVINDAMEKTTETFKGKNQEAYNDFVEQNEINPAKVGKYLQRAKKVHEAANTLDEYIDNMKKYLIAVTDGYGSIENVPHDSLLELKNVQAKDNYDEPTRILIGNEEANPVDGPWSAKELRRKIEDFKEAVVAQIPKRKQADFDPGFKFEDVVMPDGQRLNWYLGNFYHVPLAAIITNLTMYQSDLRNVEADALKILYNEIDASDFKFDKIAVKVIPKSNYVVLGDSFQADVIVAAYSTTQNPEMEVGRDIDTSGAESSWKVIDPVDQGRIRVENGVARYSYKPTTAGEVTWAGFIKLKDPTGQTKMYPFKHTFVAAKPALVVSPTKMNVFYRGLKNPLEVSVSGFSSNKISVSASGATISGSNGSYEVMPGKTSREVKIRVSVKMDDGSTKSMGEKVFRVKRVPDPLPKFAGVTGSGKVSLTQLKAASKVTVELKDFLFDGLKFQVVGFEMVGYVNGKPVTFRSNNDRVSSAMKNMLKNQRKGGMVTVKNIRVIKPGGERGVIPSNVIVEIK